MAKKIGPNVAGSKWLRWLGLFLAMAALDVAAQSVLAPVPPDKDFIASIRSLAVLDIDDPTHFTVINPMGGVLPLFGAIGGAIAAQNDAAQRQKIRDEFTAMMQKQNVEMGKLLTVSVVEKLQASGIEVHILSGARKRKGFPITNLSTIEIPAGTEALLDIFFPNPYFMAVGNIQDYEPVVSAVARIYRVKDKTLVYQQMFQYSKPMKVDGSPFRPILTEYQKGVTFPNQKAIYDSPDKALLGFQQSIEPLAGRIQAELMSWRKQ